MKKGNSTITVVVAVALSLVVALGVAYFGANTQKGDKGDRGDNGLTITGPQGPEGPKGEPGKVDLSTLRNLQNVLQSLSDVVGKLPKAKLGATPGDDHYGAYWGVNDVQTYYSRMALVTGTSTPCILQAPADATTTLIHASYALNTATSAIMLVGFARDISTTRAGGGGFATGTQVLGGTRGIQIEANTRVNLIASTTPNDVPVFGPGDFFVIKSYGGANNGYYNHTGTCEAVFQRF